MQQHTQHQSNTEHHQITETEHPVSATMKQRVLSELQLIEENYQVKVLFACESGSRAWGFVSPDSDYDVRFIYVHQPEWYLRVMPQRDVIERPLDDELDISGWELRKALQLLNASNPTLMEWLDSPIIYCADEMFRQQITSIATCCFSDVRIRYHYLSMAKKNFRGYLQGEEVRLKKYLYVIRPLLATKWIEAGLGQPPTRFSQLLSVIQDKQLLAEIDYLVSIKRRSGEAQYSQRLPLIHQFIESELARLQSVEFKSLHDAQSDRTELDQLLFNYVMQIEYSEKLAI